MKMFMQKPMTKLADGKARGPDRRTRDAMKSNMCVAPVNAGANARPD